MSDHAETLRQLANDQRRVAESSRSEIYQCELRDRAVACKAGADALAKLSDPSYLIVKREDAEKAANLLWRAGHRYAQSESEDERYSYQPGLQMAAEEAKEARSLLGLSDLEGM